MTSNEDRETLERALWNDESLRAGPTPRLGRMAHLGTVEKGLSLRRRDSGQARRIGFLGRRFAGDLVPPLRSARQFLGTRDARDKRHG